MVEQDRVFYSRSSGSALDQGSMYRSVQVSQRFTGFHWSESSFLGFGTQLKLLISKLCFEVDSRPGLLDQ